MRWYQDPLQKKKKKKNKEKQTIWAQFFTQSSRITKQLKHFQELLLGLTLNWHWDELRNPSTLVLALELAQTCWMGILLLLKTINSFPLMQVRTEIVVLLQQYKKLKVQAEVCCLQQSRTSGGWRFRGEVCCPQQSRTSSGGWWHRKFAVYNSQEPHQEVEGAGSLLSTTVFKDLCVVAGGMGGLGAEEEEEEEETCIDVPPPPRMRAPGVPVRVSPRSAAA